MICGFLDASFIHHPHTQPTHPPLRVDIPRASQPKPRAEGRGIPLHKRAPARHTHEGRLGNKQRQMERERAAPPVAVVVVVVHPL